MSFRPVFGPQQDRRVLVDGQELAVDVHRHHRVAVLELDLGDVADAHARDAHGLALAGGDRLRGLELGLELEGRLLEDRDPQPLVLDDVQVETSADHDQAEDGEEVARVLADRGAPSSVRLPVSSAVLGQALACRSRCRSSAACRWSIARPSATSALLLESARPRAIRVMILASSSAKGQQLVAAASPGSAIEAERLARRRRGDVAVQVGRLLGLAGDVGTERRLRRDRPARRPGSAPPRVPTVGAAGPGR